LATIRIDFTSQGARVAISELQRLQSAFDSTAKGTEKLAKSLNTSFKGAQQFSKNIGLSADATQKAVTRIRELDKVGATAGQKFNILNKELGISRTQFLAIDRAAGVTTRGLTTIGTAATAAAAAIGGLFVAGGRSFIAFDSAIRQSAAIAGASGEEIGILRDEVTRLGIETSKAPAEIAQTSVSLSRAGFAANETADALGGVVAASEATGESLQITGDIISRTLRTFQLTADESTRVGDALVATANNTNTTVSSIGESLSFVGSVAAAANQPLEDILVAIGLLGDAGIRGSAAGTNLAAALERLKAASAGANSEYSNLVRGNQRAIEAFNLIGASVRNADGSLKSIVEILPALRAGLQGLGQEDQDLVFKALFGVEGGRAIQTLLLATEERVDGVTTSIQNAGGAADEASGKLLKGLGGSLALLSGSVGATLIEVFKPFAPLVEGIVRAATLLLNTFLALPAPIRAALAVTTAFAGVLAAATAAIVAYNVAGGATIRTEALKAASFIKSGLSLSIYNAQLRAALVTQTGFAGATGKAAAALNLNTAALSKNAAIAAKLAVTLAGLFVIFKGVESIVNQLALAAGRSEELDELREKIEAFLDPAEETTRKFDELRSAIERIQANSSGGFDTITASLVELQAALGLSADSADTFGTSFRLSTLAQRQNQQTQLQVADAIERAGNASDKAANDLLKYSTVAGEGEGALALAAVRTEDFTLAITENVQALSSEIQFLESLKTGVEEIDAQLDAEIATRQNLIDITRRRSTELLGEASAVDAALDAAKPLQEFLDGVAASQGASLQLVNIIALRKEIEVLGQVASGAISQAEADAQTAEAQQRALEQSIDKQQRDLDALIQRRSDVVEATPEETAKLNEEILTLEEDLLNNKIELFDIEATERKKALDGAVADNKAALDAISLETAQATADLLESGGSAQQVADLERDAIAQRIEQNKELLAQLQQQPETPEVADQILSTEKAIADDRITLAQQTVDDLKDAEEQRVKDLEKSIADAEAVIDRENAARERSVLELERSLLASGATEAEIAERTAAERIRITDETIQAQIALERQRIATFGEGTDEARDATLAIAELENERIQNQIDGEKEIRAAAEARQDAEIEGIQDAADLEERKQTIIADTLALQEESLTRQADLLQETVALAESAANLQSTVLDGEIAERQSGLDLLRQQRDIQKQITDIQSDPDGDPLKQAEQIADLEQQRLSVRRQLNALGIGNAASERTLEAEILALQRERFAQEFANLQASQEADRLALEIQIEQNRLANERAIIEAQIAQARLQAEIAIADAQGNDGLANALREALGLQGQVIGNLERQQQLEEQSAQTLRDTLALQQGAETTSFLNEFANDARNLAGDITDPALAREATRFAQGVQSIADGAADAAGEAAKIAAGEAKVQLDQASSTLAAAGVSAGESILNAAQRAGEILSRQGGTPAFRDGGVTPGGMVQVHRDEFMIPPRGTRVVSQAESRALIRESLTPATTIATQGNDGRLLRAVNRLERTIRNMPAPQLNQTNNFPIDDGNWRQQSNRNALDLWGALRGI
jgi:TP901 family phage tail tape measure protein